jgi:hypothetical protein
VLWAAGRCEDDDDGSKQLKSHHRRSLIPPYMYSGMDAMAVVGALRDVQDLAQVGGGGLQLFYKGKGPP